LKVVRKEVIVWRGIVILAVAFREVLWAFAVDCGLAIDCSWEVSLVCVFVD
jgi:hypothetical protein